MKICFYSCFEYEHKFLRTYNTDGHELEFLDVQLNIDTLKLAQGCEVVSIFSRDSATPDVLEKAKEMGIQLFALRSTGYNNICLDTAKKLDIQVARVAAYSPEAIAEHSIALILALSRHMMEANKRIVRHDFTQHGLLGFNLGNKTVGVIGTGKIGAAFIKILHGFGSTIIAYDKNKNEALAEEYGVRYVSLDTLLKNSEIISLHIPLNESTFQILNEASFIKMTKGVMIINTSRGDHIETKALIRHLKSGLVTAAGLDVYANEKKYSFKDLSNTEIEDQDLLTLIEMDQVLLTGHQAYLTEKALSNIAETTFDNIRHFANKTKSDDFLN